MNTPTTRLTVSEIPQLVQNRWGSAERRFWLHVDTNGPVNERRPDLGPCWLWTGTHSTQFGKATYGQFMLDAQRMGAHRAAHLMYVGPVADGLDVMHRCDVKGCVRPSHLTTGTRTANLLDGFASPANRGVCAGENNGRARLTWDIVHAIRGGSERTVDLARLYGVSPEHVSHIKAGRKWPESSCPIHRQAVAA